MTDRDYLKLAYEFAAEFSTDRSTQNGAVLVDAEGVVLAYGANHFPEGVAETPERWERPLKYSFVEHAERNVIFDAARCGIQTEGLTMYCPWNACAECARAIIQAGIREVVGHVVPDDAAAARFADSIRIARQMLHEAGVVVRDFEGRIDPTGVLVVMRDGKPYNP